MAAQVKNRTIDESLHLNSSESFPSLSPNQKNIHIAQPTYSTYAKVLVEGKREETSSDIKDKKITDLSASDVSPEEMNRLFASTCYSDNTVQNPNIVTTAQLEEQVKNVHARIDACDFKIKEIQKKITTTQSLKADDTRETKKSVNAYNFNAKFFQESMDLSQTVITEAKEMLAKTDFKVVSKGIFEIFARTFGIKAETFEENDLKLRTQRQALLDSLKVLKEKMENYTNLVDNFYWIAQNADLVVHSKAHTPNEHSAVLSAKPVQPSLFKSLKGIFVTQVNYTIGQQYESVNI